MNIHDPKSQRPQDIPADDIPLNSNVNNKYFYDNCTHNQRKNALELNMVILILKVATLESMIMQMVVMMVVLMNLIYAMGQLNYDLEN